MGGEVNLYGLSCGIQAHVAAAVDVLKTFYRSMPEGARRNAEVPFGRFLMILWEIDCLADDLSYHLKKLGK